MASGWHRPRKVLTRTLDKAWGDSLFGLSSQAAFLILDGTGRRVTVGYRDVCRVDRRRRSAAANLTEHVRETEEIFEIAAGAARGSCSKPARPRCYLNVLGARSLPAVLLRARVDSADRLLMRVDGGELVG